MEVELDEGSPVLKIETGCHLTSRPVEAVCLALARHASGFQAGSLHSGMVQRRSFLTTAIQAEKADQLQLSGLKTFTLASVGKICPHDSEALVLYGYCEGMEISVNKEFEKRNLKPTRVYMMKRFGLKNGETISVKIGKNTATFAISHREFCKYSGIIQAGFLTFGFDGGNCKDDKVVIIEDSAKNQEIKTFPRCEHSNSCTANFDKTLFGNAVNRIGKKTMEKLQDDLEGGLIPLHNIQKMASHMGLR